MSNEGTPKRHTAVEKGKGQDLDSAEFEHAPERGEAGDNYYWHKQWTAVMSRSSRPDPAPLLELVANDLPSVMKTIKCLWTGGEAEEVKLAREFTDKIALPAKKYEACLGRKTSLRQRAVVCR